VYGDVAIPEYVTVTSVPACARLAVPIRRHVRSNGDE
jgi:hypothetical protein